MQRDRRASRKRAGVGLGAHDGVRRADHARHVEKAEVVPPLLPPSAEEHQVALLRDRSSSPHPRAQGRGVPASVHFVSHASERLPASSCTHSITLTAFENSRGAFWPPKKNMWSLGTDSMAPAMWFHSVVGRDGQTFGSSSSGLYSRGMTHSTGRRKTEAQGWARV